MLPGVGGGAYFMTEYMSCLHIFLAVSTPYYPFSLGSKDETGAYIGPSYRNHFESGGGVLPWQTSTWYGTVRAAFRQD